MTINPRSRSSGLKLALLVAGWALLLASCQPVPVLPAEQPASPGSAELAVLAEPAGAAVSIDGRPRGASPLTLTLPAGVHEVGLSAPGYAPLTEAVTLTAGQRGILAPSLLDGQAPSVKVWADATTVPWLGETQVPTQATDN